MRQSKKQEALARARKQALPEVKKVVKKFGRNVVIWCVNQMRDYEKKVKQLEQAKKAVQELESGLK